jgi:methionine biosynthesis protein MetW
MRPDLDLVAAMVPRGSRVLDLGCGDGTLLEHLIRARGCEGHGVEISADGFDACVARGVPVLQADIDAGLGEFDDGRFDVVILSQTLQATHHPRLVLAEMMRVGATSIVSFPNVGHWRLRSRLALGGRMPSSQLLPYAWYDTPNIHHCTIKDFRKLCGEIGVKMEKSVAFNAWGRPLRFSAPWWFWNLFGEQAVFILSRH